MNDKLTIDEIRLTKSLLSQEASRKARQAARLFTEQSLGFEADLESAFKTLTVRLTDAGKILDIARKI